MSVDAKHVQAVFLAAIEIADAGQRATYLDQECSSDPKFRQRVDALLQAHESPASILARPLAALSEVDQMPPISNLPMDASADLAGPSPGNLPQQPGTMDAESNER